MKITTFQVLLFFMMAFTSQAQTSYDMSQLNRSIMRHFSGEQLQALIENDSARLNKITLYFNESFEVKDYNCLECVVDKKDLFDISLFNIVDYETERKANEEISFVFKEKYLITLLSKTELNNLLGGITPFELIHGIAERAFPIWDSTGNDQLDFNNYKTEMQLWSTDFPKQFLAKKKAATTLKVRFVQFTEMTNEEKNAVLSFPGGYIIIDDEIMNYPQ